MAKVTRLLSVLLTFSACPAVADSLADTLVRTYENSPLLEANRAALRGLDENVAQALASKRPQVNATAGANYSVDLERQFNGGDLPLTETYNARLSATLSLYDGGASTAALNAAKAGVMSGRAQLKSAEQNILLQAVTAYMDVRRDTEALRVSNNNVQVLQEQVRASRDRFELGEATRTDVSVAEASLAASRAGQAAARGRLEASREVFLAVVGTPPNNLRQPPPAPKLPASLAEAEAIAMREHPDLAATRHSITSAEWNIVRAKASGRPKLQATGSLDWRGGTSAISDSFSDSSSASLGVQGEVPIYSGGRNSSLIRQAEHNYGQAKLDLQQRARVIRQNVAFAWTERQVARASVAANRQQVAAAQIAFDGVREEASLGTRTTLDVLNLEQDLRDAQVQLVSSRRDEYVAAYNLLSAMGLLTMQHLNLAVEVYDPQLHYDAVKSAPVNPVVRKMDRIQRLYGD
ncbi:TolC family outer membrane protein [Halovulum sp. GXIMD14793]